MTNEEIAIQQHLSKPRPYGHACGCMGPQPINRKDRNYNWAKANYSLRVVDFGEDRLGVISTIRSSLNISLEEFKAIKDSGKLEFSGRNRLQRDSVATAIGRMGATVECFDDTPDLEPECPCAMAWYEIVDNTYYSISELRSVDGIKLVATEVGPVGGPYKKIS